MNIIRTSVVEISTIPAIAYKQKLASGGAGLRIMRTDVDAVAVFTLNKRGGQPTAYGKVDNTLFPEAAVDEVLEATSGLPYSSRGKIVVSSFEAPKEDEDVTEKETEAIDMVGSDEYNAIVERYIDERGKMNYQLMNKNFIQFASKSKVVADLMSNNALEDEILLSIVKSRATFLSGKKESLPDDQVEALIETLDEIDPRGAFKELKSYIRRLLAQRK